jgi:uncharacterized protein (DUF885 family)
MKRWLLGWVALSLGCATSSGVAPLPSDRDDDGEYAAGVEDPALRDVVQRHWSWTLRAFPEYASQLGDHRYDDRLTDVRWSAVQQRTNVRRGFLAALDAVPDAGLSPEDRTTKRLLQDTIRYRVDEQACAFPLWSLSPRSNPITELNYLPQAQPRATVAQMRRLLVRLQEGGEQIDHLIDNLRQGVERGWVANRESTERVLTMVRSQLTQPTSEWPMVTDAAPEEGYPAEQRDAVMSELITVVEQRVRPPLERYQSFIETEILPRARGPRDGVGLAGLPFGEACYAARIRRFTTLDLTAEAIHQTGREEVARINAEMRKVGRRLFGTDDLQEIVRRLRTDPSVHFRNRSEILNKATSALAKARSVLPAFFGRLPRANCVVREIPEYEAPFTTVAYYRQPIPDGSRPGEYYVNTHAPETRTRYEAEALAYHESIPGHHLQIAIAQELSDVPEFRKHAGMTVFVEGWALYAEQLAEEMGLYGGDLDRMGQLSYEAWRASRLVVDTGLHAMGWTRQQAIDFMAEHTALARNNIDNEVDRYVVWPGQALAYKTGQLEILALRRRATERLGAHFDLPSFHDAILLGGAVSLPVLRARVEAYVKRHTP